MDVEKLWQVDVIPYAPISKTTYRSRQDQEAFECLASVKQVEINGIARYATPLFQPKNAPRLNAPPNSVMAALLLTEHQIARNPVGATICSQEIQKLEQAGYVKRLIPKEAASTDESWYVPQHLVGHNGKH